MYVFLQRKLEEQNVRDKKSKIMRDEWRETQHQKKEETRELLQLYANER